MPVFYVNKGANPNYLVEIKSTTGVTIIADMPEEIVRTISNSWEPRMPYSLAEVTGALDMAARLAGENVLVQEFSRLMWMDTTPIEIPLTLLFDARSDAYQEVFLPMVSLELLSLPDASGYFLTAPGPSVINPDRNRISLTIGRQLYIHSVIMTSLSTQIDSRLDKNGYPISGQSDITFSTDRIMSKTDWRATVI